MAQAQEVFLFNPTNVTGCQLWLDAADPNNNNTLPANGANISTWVDKSGNGRNATYSTAATNPTYTRNALNGLPVITNTGSSGLSGTFAVNGFTNMFIFIICNNTSSANYTNNTGYYALWWAETGGWGQIQLYISQSRIDWRFGTGQVSNQPTFNLPSNVSTSYNLYCVNKVGTAESVFQNGTSIATYTASLSAIANTSSTYTITGPVSTTYATNNIAEIVIYNANIGTSGRQQLEGYLAWKWGLQGSLPANHPFKNYRPLANPPIPTQVPNAPFDLDTVEVFLPTSVTGCQLWLDAADSSTVTTTSGIGTLNTYVQPTPTTSTVTYTGTLDSLASLASGTCLMQSGFINVGNGNGFVVPSATIGDFYAFCYDGGYCKTVRLRFTLSGPGGTLSVTAVSAGFNSVQFNASLYLYTTNSPTTNDTLYASYNSMAVVTSPSGNGYGVANFSINFAATTQWRDKSSSSNNATGSATAPTYDAIGRFMRFNGSSQAFSLPNGALPTGDGAYTIFTLAYTNTFASNQFILVGGAEVTNQAIQVYYGPNGANNGAVISWVSTNVNYPLIPATFPAGTIGFIYAGYPGTAGFRYITVNGAIQLVGISGTVRSNPNTGNFIGRQISGASFLNGGVGEIIVYNRYLTTSEKRQVEGYLAWKWGLQSAYLAAQYSGDFSPFALNPIAPFPFRSIPFIGSVNQWQPLQISGTQLWLDASDPNNNGTVPAAGASITTWVDKSGNGRNMTATTSGTGSIRYSTYGNRSSILFNSAGANTAYMRVVSAVNLTNLTVFAVYLCQSALGNQVGLLAVPQTAFEYNSTDGFGQFIDTNQDRFYGSGTPNNNLVTNAVTAGVEAIPLRMNSWVNTSAGLLSSWVNGNTGTTNALGSARTSTATGFGIGFDIQGSAGTPANLITISQFSEFLVYNVALGQEARQQVEGYLAWKWGLQRSLPANHPFILFPPPP